MSDYRLAALTGILSHTPAPVIYLEDADELKDIDDHLKTQELKAHVRSGDYFSLLATRLDDISQALSDSSPEQTILLQHLIDNLLYLQKHYNIVAK